MNILDQIRQALKRSRMPEVTSVGPEPTPSTLKG